MTHPGTVLLSAYALVFVPMVVALVRGRAPWSTLLLSPLYALALTVIAGIVFGGNVRNPWSWMRQRAGVRAVVPWLV